MLKAAITGIVAILFAMQFKNSKSEYAVYISFAAGIILIFMVISRFMIIKNSLEELQQYIDINPDYIVIMIKIAGISYISDITSTMCEDAGFRTIASQIEMIGRMSILTISIPVLLALFETITGM
ncbi:MAG: SpoIIIAC/SpoIIIAD family protein [Lachnospiraceae bacterium]|mgnify:FL=1|uniref:SpoIIIAC/SpoIIIAD family protein n=1 Tax=Falcatimonas sp. MSJ-15 TaxID=2841515 RepID=UPI001C11B182|nr:SpoIIIAC/SpoIIIAD family protein [Falcatimonas sp. MSJ-15]MBQ5734685.1 stage III sporulation protein AD [Lachnospiraceae bacterium]MBU5471485.1 stage III sporulation protein AD [Falcatimonas sp. MSJ-15]MEE0958990.1 SpoIIIAC/SpoIIIAD family protein [Lachnospiraceae bacterium]